MPKISRTYAVSELEAAKLFELSKEAFQKMNVEITGEEIKSEKPFLGEISVFVSSIWGWGGMKMGLIVKEAQVGSILEITGYIAQLATDPLKKSMDAFYHELSKLMRNDPGPPKGTMPTARPVHTEK